MANKPTSEDSGEGFRQLLKEFDETILTRRHPDELKRELATEPVMRVLADCCRQNLVKPSGGADLGAILIGHQFKQVFEEYGLVIMPLRPSKNVGAAFARGWLSSFQTR
jgi:hypothetical protein